MSSFGSQIRKRIEELRKAGANVPEILDRVNEAATIAAVEKTVQNTPPNGAAIAGTKTRSGELAQHWVTDSTTQAVNHTTVLANSMQYASYVNDGHRMDKHFVPGLIENGGLLEMVDPSEGGLMVGTRTQYVPGLYMKEKGIGKWRTEVKRLLEMELRENFK